MENKKTFGTYICQRRKELGLTQKEFAQRIFVTDSAVSKWERGLAYPDITLLQSICQVLQCSEKELLSSSEDIEGRRAEQLAKKYLCLTRTYCLGQFLLFGAITLGCLLGNLIHQHTLTWFWIVLSSELMVFSLTLLPTFVPEGRRAVASLGSFTACLILLLGVCCLYTNGDWFAVAAVSVLFAFGLVFLPLVLRNLPLPPWLSCRKASLYVGIEFLLLVALFGVCCLYSNGQWFLSATLWTLFGTGIFLLPPLLHQLPLPKHWQAHQAMVYLSVETFLLLVGLAWEGRSGAFPLPMLPIALLFLTLPWGWLLSLRYLPIRRWFRAGTALSWTALWLWLTPFFFDQIFLATGHLVSQPYWFHLPVDFTNWTSGDTLFANVFFLILLGLLLLAIICIAAGLLLRKKRHP